MIMKVKSLMNNPEDEGYDEQLQTFIDGVEVKYGDEIEISDEFKKSRSYKNMLSQKMFEVIKETKK